MNDTIHIYNSTVNFPGDAEALKPHGVSVVGMFQAVNREGVRFASAADTSTGAVHFRMLPLSWEPDEDGKTPAELGDDVILVIQRVHCAMAALAISEFEANSYDNVVCVTLNNPSHKAITLSPGEVRVDVLAIRTGSDWRVPPVTPPDDVPSV